MQAKYKTYCHEFFASLLYYLLKIPIKNLIHKCNKDTEKCMDMRFNHDFCLWPSAWHKYTTIRIPIQTVGTFRSKMCKKKNLNFSAMLLLLPLKSHLENSLSIYWKIFWHLLDQTLTCVNSWHKWPLKSSFHTFVRLSCYF